MIGIKLNRKSWHYRLVTIKANELPSSNLCTYFWQVVCQLLKFGSIYGAVIAICGSFITFWGVTPFYGFMPELDAIPGVVAALVLLGFIVNAFVVFVLVGLVFQYCAKSVKWLYKRITKNPSMKPDQPNVLVEYVKAKKKKVCPKIDWE